MSKGLKHTWTLQYKILFVANICYGTFSVTQASDPFGSHCIQMLNAVGTEWVTPGLQRMAMVQMQLCIY